MDPAAGRRAEQSGQRTREARVGLFLRGTSDLHDEVDFREALRHAPEAFANEPLDAVTGCRITHGLAADGDSEARMREFVRPQIDGEEGIPGAVATAKGQVERRRIQKPVGARKCLVPALQRRDQVGVSRARPFARRALITRRPPRVRILARKPWVRARFSRLGWKVLFMAGSRDLFGYSGHLVGYKNRKF